MKNRTANGAAKRMTAKRADAILKDWKNRQLDEQSRRQHTEIKLTVRIDAFNWGLLNAAALVNGCTPVEALEGFIQGGNRMNEWWNDSCPLDTLIVPGGKP